jgi:hypothetical protein
MENYFTYTDQDGYEISEINELLLLKHIQNDEPGLDFINDAFEFLCHAKMNSNNSGLGDNSGLNCIKYIIDNFALKYINEFTHDVLYRSKDLSILLLSKKAPNYEEIVLNIDKTLSKKIDPGVYDYLFDLLFEDKKYYECLIVLCVFKNIKKLHLMPPVETLIFDVNKIYDFLIMYKEEDTINTHLADYLNIDEYDLETFNNYH